MADVTVAQFAEVLKIPVDKLLVQLEQAGIAVGGPADRLSDEAKLALLTHLRRSHGQTGESAGLGSAPRKITLQRKQQSEIKLAAGAGRARTVNVEVRVKRTYVKRETTGDQGKLEADEAEAQRLQAEENVRLERERQDSERRESEAMEAENRRRVDEEANARRNAEEARRLAEQRENAAAGRSRGGRNESAAVSQRAPDPRTTKATPPASDGDRERRTKYGRAELHVTGDTSSRFKKKKRTRDRKAPAGAEALHGFELPTIPVVREVSVGETITPQELAQKMAIKATEVIKIMMNMGVMATINQPIDQDTAVLVIEEMGHTAKVLKDNQMESDLQGAEGMAIKTMPRAPVVTVMGHVDHGKTSLLDYIRKSKVASGEAGGITQHIGAYHVQTSKGGVTFLDTPGHSAFTAMRARGAKATDVVVLVVAADDGVMPQTIEAVEHARAAGVSLVVAVNKIDKPSADPDRVRTELSKHNVIPEEWGGQNIFVNVSAVTGDGVDRLLDAILLQAEILELAAPLEGLASGLVIEASMEKGRGVVATVLVKKGILRIGDPIIAGQEFGCVRAMFNEIGQPVTEAFPSMPVQVLGLSGAPNAGDDILVVGTERKAREVALYRQGKFRDVKLAKQAADVGDVFAQMTEEKVSVIGVMIKTDVQGSAEALRDALKKLSTDEVKVKIVASGVGGITASDVQLAAASNAFVIGFNVRADGGAREAVKATGTEIRYFSIIYEAIDDVKQRMSGMLSPEVREQIVGVAQVRDVFRSSKFGVVAGCLIMEGTVKRNNPIRVLRDSVVIFEGALESLRRFKDDVSEVRAGTECGIGVKNYQDVRAGDQIECYSRVELARVIA